MGFEKTPGRKAREKSQRHRYDYRAKKMSGEVVTKFVCPLCTGPHAKKDCPSERS